MKKMCRRLYRLPLLTVWLLFQAFRSLPLRYQRDRDESIRRMAAQMKIWATVLLKILSIEVRIHGDLQPYRREGGLVVSNHVGYVDVLVHSTLSGMRFAPKAEVQKWPFFGWYTGMSNPIWVDRASRSKSREVLEEFRRTLLLKVPLIVYPEGTTTDGRHGILPFKSTGFESVVSTDIPVQPLVTLYHTQGKDDVNPAWFGDWEFLPHLWQLLGNKRTVADVFVLPLMRAGDDDRKTFAAKVYYMMDQVYTQQMKEMENEKV